MELATVLYFDSQTDGILTGCINEMIKNGVNNNILEDCIRPHITLGIWSTENLMNYCQQLELFASGQMAFDVKFSSLGIFPYETDILYLSPAINDHLIEIHNQFYKAFPESRYDYVDYYTKTNWVPHSTLALYLSEAETGIAIRIAKKLDLPLHARVEKIALISCCPLEEVAIYPLVNH